MQNSSALCRAQQAIQIKRAADTSLSNVRSIASAAAAAWGAEALLADKRERRQQPAITAAAAAVEADRSLSENPDRGFAEARAA